MTNTSQTVAWQSTQVNNFVSNCRRQTRVEWRSSTVNTDNPSSTGSFIINLLSSSFADWVDDEILEFRKESPVVQRFFLS